METHRGKPWLLAGTAVFAVAWVIARACLQSITIDEADSFALWSATSSPEHWKAAASNHVLNSALIRLFTSVFGVYPLTVRAPALIGGGVYIAAAYWLCRMMARRTALRWALFVCFVYNPLVMDFLVAARGYGLAAGFLLTGIAVAAYSQLDGTRISRIAACALCSAAMGLSVAANFSFALVDASVLLLVFVWARPWRPSLVAACVLPGLAISLLLSLPVMWAFPKSEFVYGVNSLGKTWRSVFEASLYRPNPHIANSWVHYALVWVGPWLFPALGVLLVIQIAFVYRALLKTGLAAVAAGAIVLSLSGHLVMHHFFGVMLPEGRTALYLVPLSLIVAGSACAVRRAGFNFLLAGLFVLAGYHFFCLRLTYFKDWYWNAEARQVYDVLAYYNHTYGVKNVAMRWDSSPSLNFYRCLSGRESLSEFIGTVEHPPDRQVYVLNRPFEQQYIGKYCLKVVYEGPRSEIVVAIRPELTAPPGSGTSGSGSRGR